MLLDSLREIYWYLYSFSDEHNPWDGTDIHLDPPWGTFWRKTKDFSRNVFQKRCRRGLRALVSFAAARFRSRPDFFSYLWDSQTIVKNLFILKNEKHLSISSATTRILTQPDGKRSQAIHRYAAILDLHFKKSQS